MDQTTDPSEAAFCLESLIDNLDVITQVIEAAELDALIRACRDADAEAEQ